MDCTMPTPNGQVKRSRARNLLCWLFSHHFFPAGIGLRCSGQNHSASQSSEVLDTCIRCGVTKGELEKQHSPEAGRTRKGEVGKAGPASQPDFPASQLSTSHLPSEAVVALPRNDAFRQQV